MDCLPKKTTCQLESFWTSKTAITRPTSLDPDNERLVRAFNRRRLLLSDSNFARSFS